MEIEETLGKYKLLRETTDYAFTSDSVLLARFLRAKKGERVADFCAGCGIVGFQFLEENPSLESVVFFEMRKEAASLCEKSIFLNSLGGKCEAECVRVQEIPSKYVEKFSLILCNPPYFQGGIVSPKPCRALSMNERELSIEELVSSVARCLKFGGRFAFIHRAERLAEIFCALKERNLEPKILQFVAGGEEKMPYGVLISAVKGGRKGLKVLPTLVNKKTLGEGT